MIHYVRYFEVDDTIQQDIKKLQADIDAKNKEDEKARKIKLSAIDAKVDSGHVKYNAKLK